MRKFITILLASGAMFLSGCESADTRDAKLDGMIIKDANGRYWTLVHNLGDTYFLREVKTNFNPEMANQFN